MTELPELPAPPLRLPRWASLVLAPNPGPMTLTGTCTWLLQAHDGCVVVDPGPLDEAHLARVAAAGPVSLIVLTHHHHDHSDGAPRLHELTGAPVAAHDHALCLGAEPLREGDVLALADDTDVTVLHTPGHTADSLSLHVGGAEPAVLTGDSLLGGGSTVVAHPDGELGAYLATLRRYVALDPHGQLAVLPGHGPARTSLGRLAAEQLAHREQRVTQVRGALVAGDRTAEQVVERLYPDLTGELARAALRTVRATLAWLSVSEPGG